MNLALLSSKEKASISDCLATEETEAYSFLVLPMGEIHKITLREI